MSEIDLIYIANINDLRYIIIIVSQRKILDETVFSFPQTGFYDR